MVHISSICPELYLTFNLIALIVYYGYYTISTKYKYIISYKINYILPSLTILYTTLITMNNEFSNIYTCGDILYLTSYNNMLKIFVSSILLLLFISSYSYIRHMARNNFETNVLLLSTHLGILLLLSSNNLLFTYLNIELVTISTYLLVSLSKTSNYNVEAALKYFIIGAVSSGMLLLGLSILYGYTGTLDVTNIKLYMNSTSLIELMNSQIKMYIILSALFVINGLLFKLYSAPYHLWISDIYQGTPLNILYYISTIPSLVITIIFLQITEIYNCYLPLDIIILAFAILSILLGSLGALPQRKLKRLLAYSSVTHVGYFLLAIGIYLSGYLIGLFVLVFYYILYLINVSGLFVQLLSNNVLKNKHQKYIVENITDFKNFATQNKVTAFLTAFTLFSVAGIPPFPGFISKLMLIYSLIKNNYSLGLLIFFVITTVISSYYYLSIVKNIYFNKSTCYIFKDYYIINTVVSIIIVLFLTTFLIAMNSYTLLTYNWVLNYITHS